MEEGTNLKELDSNISSVVSTPVLPPLCEILRILRTKHDTSEGGD